MINKKFTIINIIFNCVMGLFLIILPILLALSISPYHYINNAINNNIESNTPVKDFSKYFFEYDCNMYFDLSNTKDNKEDRFSYLTLFVSSNEETNSSSNKNIIYSPDNKIHKINLAIYDSSSTISDKLIPINLSLIEHSILNDNQNNYYCINNYTSEFTSNNELFFLEMTINPYSNNNFTLLLTNKTNNQTYTLANFDNYI